MNTDDPRLTAYALGELEPPELAEIEAFLKDNPVAAREVAEIRQMAGLVRTQLATEAAPPLAPSQQREILTEAATPRRVILEGAFPTSNWRRVWVPAAIAACAAVVAGYGVLYHMPTLYKQQTPADGRKDADFHAAGGAGLVEAEKSSAAYPPAGAAGYSFSVPANTPTLAPVPTEPQFDAITTTPMTRAPAPTAASGPALEKQLREANFLKSDGSAPLQSAQRSAAPVTKTGASEPEAKSEVNRLISRGLVFENQGGMLKDDGRREAGRRKQVGDKEQSALAQPEGAELQVPATSSVSQTSAPAPARSAPSAGSFMVGRAGGTARATASPTDQSAAPAAPASKKKEQADRSRDWQLTKSWDRPVRRFNEGREGAAKNAPLDAALPGSPAGASANLDSVRELPPEVALGFLSSGDRFDNAKEPDEKAKMLTRTAEPLNTESYDSVTDNAFLQAQANPLSTFSIDVDTASYSNVRRFLTAGQRPPKGAVRIEELVNYFKYSYPEPKGEDPVAVHMEVAGCPWTPTHRLLRIGLKARELDIEKRPQVNLIFLLDVSGSMDQPNKLPLVKQSLRLLIDKLGPQDSVGIVVYAGASGTVLEPTNDKDAMRAALDKLSAGGSTNGGSGIRLAYEQAKIRFEKGKSNRVILATDGDFNVGTTSQSELTDLIKTKAQSGVFLTVLGFGYGNLKDSTMEMLADKGNGNYAYIDNIAEGRKVLVEQMAGTLHTVAKDVKMQIEFNPLQVAAYRLIGYENRLLAKEDFNDDTKDAGEIGAGHTVTALYEVVPAGQSIPGARELTGIDALKYQAVPGASNGLVVNATGEDRANNNAAAGKASAAPAVEAKVPAEEMLTLKLRWKAPDGDVSTKREFPLTDAGLTWEKSSTDFRWAASVAGFGMLLRDSPHKGQATWAMTRELAIEGQGVDADSHRIEFLDMIGKAEALAK